MKQMEETLESVKARIEQLLGADGECQAGEIIVYKKREMDLYNQTGCFHCIIDHDISFKDLLENGNTFNQAEIFLLPEEYPAFIQALKEFPVPFPTNYRQWQQVNPHIISVCMESVEPPEHFAERLAHALAILEE